MTGELSRSAKRVQAALAALGTGPKLVQLPSTAKTAVDAANAIGCSVEQIAKSILFRTVKEKKPVMVIASGSNRVNEATIADFVGEPVEKADADYVRRKTGFAIGGVPPIGHAEPISIIIDEDLMRYGQVWAAAGTPNSVFKISATSLLEMTAGTLMSIK